MKPINIKPEILIIDNRFMVNDIAYYDESDGRNIGVIDRKSTRLNSSHSGESRMPPSA